MALLCLLSVIPIRAQYLLSGAVLDGDGNRLPAAVIVLVNRETDQLVNQTVPDTAGRYSFTLQQSLPDAYLMFSAPGYRDTTVVLGAVHAPRELNPVRLQLSMNVDIEAVSVTANSFSTTLKPEGIRFKVVNQTLIRNNSSFGILRLTPLLQVDELQGIQMVGKKDVQIYINGRKSRMSRETMLQYLQNLPAGELDDIEVVTNPGSTYNVGGETGVINITLKGADRQGWKGTLNTRINQAHSTNPSISINTNYLHNKFSLNMTGGFNYSKNYNRIDELYIFNNTDDYYHRVGRNDGPSRRYSFNTDALYRIDERHSIGAVADLNIFNSDRPQKYTIDYGNKNGFTIDSTTLNTINRDQNTSRISGNINYTFTPDKNSQLKIDVDYLYNNNKSNQHYIYKTLLTDGERLRENYYWNNPQENHIGLLKVEYSRTANGHRMVFGIDASLTSTDYKEEYRDREPDAAGNLWEPNLFDFRDRGATAYLSHSKTWSPKFSTTAGARLEYTYMKGKQRSTAESFSQDHLFLLPSLSLMYSPLKTLQLSYSVGMRSGMPAYSMYNPFAIYSNPEWYRIGNPELGPARDLNHSLNIVLPKGFLLIAYQNITYDAYQYVDNVLPGTNVIEFKPVNYGRVNRKGVILNYSGNIIKGTWIMNASVDANHVRYIKTIESNLSDNNKGWGGMATLNNIFILSAKHKWQATLTAMYMTRRILLNSHMTPFLVTSASLRKNFKNCSLELLYLIAANYINGRFTTQLHENVSTPEYIAYKKSLGDFQVCYLNFSWNFGNNKVKTARVRSNTDNYKKRVSEE